MIEKSVCRRVSAQTIFFRKLVEGGTPGCGAYKEKEAHLGFIFL